MATNTHNIILPEPFLIILSIFSFDIEKKSLLIFHCILRNMPRDRKIGAPPGTLVHIGEKMNGNIKISQITYDKEGLEEYVIPDVINIELDATRNNWIDIQGLHDVDVIAKLGKKYDIHSLVLEDIVNTEHRPKIEEYEDYVFII